MDSDPHEEFFRRQRNEEERDKARMREVGVRAVAVVLDWSTGVASLLGRAVGEASKALANKQTTETDKGVDDVESRLARYERSAATRLSGPRLRLLELTLNAALQEVWGSIGSAEARDALQLTPAEYSEAAKELEELGLVYADGNANDPTGYARTRLHEAAALRVGPTLHPEIDWERDVTRTLVSMVRDRTEGYVFAVRTLAERTGIPGPRLSLLVDTLEALGIIKGRGPGSDQFGSFHTIELTSHGKRVLRGDATVL